jgi:hypothetical protein
MMLPQHRCNDVVPQVVAPHSTRIHTVTDDDLRISNLVKIAEVDRFGSDPELPQHDGVPWWSSPRFLLRPLGSHTGGRDKGERGGVHGGEERSQLMGIVLFSPPPLGASLYRGMGASLPLHQVS